MDTNANSLYLAKLAADNQSDFAQRLTLRTRFKVRWLDLCRPGFHGNCFYPYGIQNSFYAYQWMVRTASNTTLYRGALDGLSCCSAVGSWEAAPLGSDWIEQLRTRLWHGVLSDHFLRKWRKDHGVAVGGSRLIPCRSYRCDDSDGFAGDLLVRPIVDALLRPKWGKLNYSPNEYHQRARAIASVRLRVLDCFFRVDVDYGYKNDSGWILTSSSGAREPLLDFILRATAWLKDITA